MIGIVQIGFILISREQPPAAVLLPLRRLPVHPVHRAARLQAFLGDQRQLLADCQPQRVAFAEQGPGNMPGFKVHSISRLQCLQVLRSIR
ncbi:hypothetical protein D3C76_1456190 [compost metagenome]